MNVLLARIKKQMTQKELATLVGIGPAKLVEAEKGNYENLRFKEMKKIAQILDSTVQELFFSDEE